MYLIVLLLVGLVFSVWGGIIEPSSRHSYADKSPSGLDLLGTGIRKKGPLKVYSVGFYLPKEQLVKTCKVIKKTAASDLKKSRFFTSQLTSGSFPREVMLRMARDVSSDKMANALADAVEPRMCGDLSALGEMKEAISSGLGQSGATTNTVMTFSAPNNGQLVMKINGQKLFEVKNKALVSAFMGVYCDQKCVSPSLKDSMCAKACEWLGK